MDSLPVWDWSWITVVAIGLKLDSHDIRRSHRRPSFPRAQAFAGRHVSPIRCDYSTARTNAKTAAHSPTDDSKITTKAARAPLPEFAAILRLI